jgi:hypothetical protein
LESIARNTDIVMPPEFMQYAKDAIKRDGIALARVPPNFAMELTKYGGSDQLEMLKFRLSIFPRDPSSWKILDVCLLAVVLRLETWINQAKPQLSLVNDINIFHDCLLALLRRVWISLMEIDVCYSWFNIRTRTCMRL